MHIKSSFRHTFFPVVILTCSFLLFGQKHVFAQKDKRLKEADTFYAKGEYLTAAGLYDQFLKTDPRKIRTRFPVGSLRNNTGITGSGLKVNDVLYKKAECYRLAHYLPEAIQAYNEAYAKDSVKYVDALYWKAVCQRSLLITDSASATLDLYAKNGSTAARYRANANTEREILGYVSQQVQRADTVLYTISKINSVSGVKSGIYAPVPAGGENWVVTSTAYDSLANTYENPYHNRLFQARVQGGTFTTLDKTTFDSLDISLNQGAACLSTDGNTLYLTQWKKNTKASQSRIYVSTKKGNSWTYPVLYTALQTDAANYQQPYLTMDGRTLFFASDRAGGLGKLDIWYATLAADGSIESIKNAGTSINSSGNEQAPFYHSMSGVLYFSTDGRIGMGGYDLFAAAGSGESWKDAINMGYPVNSTRDDIYFYAGAEGLRRNALFCSDRGSGCCLETYTLEKRPKKRRLTGKVVDCDGATPIEGAVVSWKGEGNQIATVSTGAGGMFSFELEEKDDPDSLIVTKETFKDKSAAVLISSRNEEDLLLDVLQNEDLCLTTAKVIVVEEVLTLYFDFDKSAIRRVESKILDSVANILAANPKATVQIAGYTDGLGTVNYNQGLGGRRANAAAKYLISKGITEDRIVFESFGECCPVEEETLRGRDNPRARRKNRRALVYIRK